MRAEAYAFHGLDRVAGLRQVGLKEALDRPAAMAMRIGQPFRYDEFAPLTDYAPITSVVMLDTIAMDCQQLDDTGLEPLWATVADTVDLLGFNSVFSRDQFRRRFAIPERVVQFVSRCSTDVADYADADRDEAGAGVLLVGNHYPHKHVRETLAALRAAAPDLPVTVLGVEVAPQPGVTAYVAGELSQQVVDDLYAQAGVVLFPSHYEGFGLPIVHALARRRPVIARDLPCAREIRALSAAGDNLYLAGSTGEMVALAADLPRWRKVVPPPGWAPSGWGAAADAVADAIVAAVARFDFGVCRRRQGRVLAQRAQPVDATEAWMRPIVVAQGGTPLPAQGQGFMLGDMIEVGQATGAMPPHDGVEIAFEASLDDRGGDAIVADLLDRLRDRGTGSVVVITLDAANPGAAARIATAILLACGCGVTAVERKTQGVTASGVYRHDWTALLVGPAGDADFVRHVYRQTLGRNPDPAGGRAYMAELADGLKRDAMLRLFLSSDERRDTIAAQMTRRGILV